MPKRSRRDVEYHRRTIELVSKVLRCIPYGLSLDDRGYWLERAFFLSRLHNHVKKRLGEEKAFIYVNYLIEQKRDFKIHPELYALMIEAGEKPLFARWWRKWVHMSFDHFMDHAMMFREYLDPENTYALSHFQ
jgi:hypothetical protein